MWYYSPSRYTAAPDFFLKNVLRRFGIEAVSFRLTDTPAQLATRVTATAPVRLASKSIMREIKTIRTFMGTMCDPNTGWMLMLSLETLKLRMKRAAQSAQTIADWLRQHPLVARTYYFTHLEHDPAQQNIYRRHYLSPGSMISFDIRGGEAEAFRFLNALKLIKLAVSLGGTESLAEHPDTMTHSDITLDKQRDGHHSANGTPQHRRRRPAGFDAGFNLCV